MGFRPATWAQYQRMFTHFIAFLETENVRLLQMTTITLLAFMEFCHNSGFSQANISNYMSGIRAMFIVHGLNTDSFKDERLPLYIKSLKINAAFTPRTTELVSVDILQQIVSACMKLQDPVIYLFIYVYSFIFVLLLFFYEVVQCLTTLFCSL